MGSRKNMGVVSVAWLLIWAHCALGAIPPGSPFKLVWDEGPLAVQAGGSFELKLTIRVPEGHYLYADETEVDLESLEGLIVSDIRFPKPEVHDDPYLNKRSPVYRGDVEVVISGRVPEGLKKGARDLVARLAFRGCSPKICFRPEEREALFRIEVLPVASAEPAPDGEALVEGPPPPARPGLAAWLKVRDFALLMERGIGLTLLIVFLAGVLTSLTPCVWPVIPVVLVFVGVHPHKRFWQNLLLAASLISGLIIVYSALGIAAVAAGKNLGFLFQHRAFLALVVAFFLAMSLSMFGVFDIRIPRRWQHRLHSLGGEGYGGAILAGMGTGLIASPCSGPVLAALLGHVALQRSYALGFALLCVYGIGMGLLIVILGAGYGELAGRLKGGAWMVWVRRALGLILLFPAAFYMGSLFRWSGEGIFAPSPRIAWVASESEALSLARATSRPVMIEFGADWCPPCRALDRELLSRDDIVALSFGLVPLRVDATVEGQEVARLIAKYEVRGWPTVIFLDPRGRQHRDLRVDDYDAAAIERGMREAIKRSEAL